MAICLKFLLIFSQGENKKEIREWDSFTNIRPLETDL